MPGGPERSLQLLVLGLLLMAVAAGRLFFPGNRVQATYRALSLRPEGRFGATAPGLVKGDGAIWPQVDVQPTDGAAYEKGALNFRGVLSVEKAGLHALGLVCNRKASIWLGSHCIAKHVLLDPVLAARSVVLAAGDYPLSVQVDASSIPLDLVVMWQQPGGRLSVIPRANLSHETGRSASVRVFRVESAPLESRELSFPLAHAGEIADPVFFHWDHARLGIPAFWPLYTVEFTAALTGAGNLNLDGNGAVTGQIGEQLVDNRKWKGPVVVESSKSARQLRLEFVPDGEPADRFSLVSAPGLSLAAPGMDRIAAITGIAGCVLTARAYHGGIYPTPTGLRRGAMVGILGLAALLRLDHYTAVPRPMETEDELIHHWNGRSLLAGSGSMGWSDYPAYGPRERTFWWGRHLALVKPFLDWPPAMCLLTGLVSGTGGSPFDVALDRTRLLPIFLGILTTWMVYRVARQLWGGTRAPLLAAALYATLPTAVATARLVKAEALMAFLTVLSLHLALRALRGKGHTLLLFVLALLVAVKQSGIAVALAIALYFYRKQKATAGLLLLAAAGGLAAQLAWGWAVAPTLFTAVQKGMARAPVAPENFLEMIAGSAIVDRSFGRGWSIWLWFSALTVEGGGLVKITLVFYTTLVSLTTWFPFGWYRIPIYPLLSILAAPAVLSLVEDPRLEGAFLLATTVLIPSLAYRIPECGAATRPLILALLVFVLAIPLARRWGTRTPSRNLVRAYGAFLLVFTILLFALVSLHLVYIDPGLYKERIRAFTSVDGSPGRRIRWQ